MSIPGRDQLAARCGFTICIALAAVIVAIATVSADTYAPFCEAPIQQCASEDRGPHGTGGAIQLYPRILCDSLIQEATAVLTAVLHEGAGDPYSVNRIAKLLHTIAHHCG